MPYSGEASGMRSSRLSSLAGLLLGFFRHPGLLDAIAHFGDLGRFIVAFAQLLLDVPKLLAQDVLALLGGKRLLGLLADLLGELEHLDALREQAEHLVEALLDIDRLQHLLFFRRASESMMPAMKSASAEAEVKPAMVATTSGGTFSSSWIASPARLLIRPTLASISGVITSDIPISSTFAARKGKPGRNSTMRKRRTPCAMA